MRKYLINKNLNLGFLGTYVLNMRVYLLSLLRKKLKHE